MQYPRKIYVWIQGFINFAGFKFAEDRGRLMEKSGCDRTSKDKIQKSIKLKYFTGRIIRAREVDFVIREGLPVKQPYSGDKCFKQGRNTKKQK